jgi:hypothetical protein
MPSPNSPRLHRPRRRSGILLAHTSRDPGPESGETAAKPLNCIGVRTAASERICSVNEDGPSAGRFQAKDWSWRRATTVPLRVFDRLPSKRSQSASPMQNGTPRNSLRAKQPPARGEKRNSRRSTSCMAVSSVLKSTLDRRLGPRASVSALPLHGFYGKFTRKPAGMARTGFLPVLTFFRS